MGFARYLSHLSFLSLPSTCTAAKTCARRHMQVIVETGAPTLALHCGGKIKPRMALLQLPCMPAEQVICDMSTTKVTTCCT